jgi:carboxymethylenebutenolidase
MRRPLFLFLLLAIPFTTACSQKAVDERMETSPRHQEWVTIEYDDRAVEAFLVYPEVSEAVPAVIVIHENRGLNDWVRSVADRLAEEGYLAIAPDLLSGMGPDGGKTSDFSDSDAAREALYNLPPDQITADLHAVANYVKALPAANGTVAVSGFCWGGSQTFRFATNEPDLSAAYVFYGSGPEDAIDLARIEAPVYGFYGGDDARVNATIPDTEALMAEAGKTYEPVIYEGAGHGFMRAGVADDASAANRQAHTDAWARWLDLLEEL